MGLEGQRDRTGWQIPWQRTRDSTPPAPLTPIMFLGKDVNLFCIEMSDFLEDKRPYWWLASLSEMRTERRVSQVWVTQDFCSAPEKAQWLSQAQACFYHVPQCSGLEILLFLPFLTKWKIHFCICPQENGTSFSIMADEAGKCPPAPWYL